MEVLSPHWVAVWTSSRHEKLVHDQLSNRGVEVFLPLVETPSRRKDRRKTIDLPVFPGYLFARLVRSEAHTVKSTRGIVRILGPTPDEYSVVPDGQIQAVRTMVESCLTIDPFPYLKEGTMVRVKNGPLEGLEGILLEKRKRLRIVVSVDLLGESISSEISAEQVETL